jgi:hypothetical protein
MVIVNLLLVLRNVRKSRENKKSPEIKSGLFYYTTVRLLIHLVHSCGSAYVAFGVYSL